LSVHLHPRERAVFSMLKICRAVNLVRIVSLRNVRLNADSSKTTKLLVLKIVASQPLFALHSSHSDAAKGAAQQDAPAGRQARRNCSALT
jgi:hypothetical protein